MIRKIMILQIMILQIIGSYEYEFWFHTTLLQAMGLAAAIKTIVSSMKRKNSLFASSKTKRSTKKSPNNVNIIK